MRQVSIAVTQMACGWDRARNVRTALDLVRRAHALGANIVLLQELFETPYFCVDKDPRFFAEARPRAGNPTLRAFQTIASELQVVIPVSFFEADGSRYFNSLAVIDADGALLGVYRKSHIPDFEHYEEAFYFSPGDTGFMVFPTRFGRIGTAVCWDQWFPEAARVMTLRGAELLLYPTAIGNNPQQPALDSRPHWQCTMQGHAAANMVVVAAANRIGRENGRAAAIDFYGGSFIADFAGRKVAEAGQDEALVHASFDLDEVAVRRRNWGMFRTRRTDLYEPLLQPAPQPLIDMRAAQKAG